MAAIIKELTLAATPQRVWDALTQSEEIACWWTDDLSVTPEVGSLAEFRFSQKTFVIQFEVAELDEGSKIHWITRQGPSTGHWAGTSVTWQLEPVPNGTRVTFNHDGFIKQDYRYDMTRAWWENFLSSLQSYLESGKGSPGSVAFRFKKEGTTSAIIEGRIIAAMPQRVWSALTNPEEIVRWWAEEVRGGLEVGSLGEFRFRPPAGTLQFEIAELDQNEKVHWISRKGPPHWAETSVTWQLEPVQGGTKLVFTHDGFAQVDEIYEQTRGNWRYFLDSLKSYIETGKGSPGIPASTR